LINILGGNDLGMHEVDEAAKIIAEAADPDANIIFGTTINENMKDQIKITVIATGFDQTKQKLREYVVPRQKREEPVHQLQEAPKISNLSHKEDEDKEDVWDIPAFLRQKN